MANWGGSWDNSWNSWGGAWAQPQQQKVHEPDACKIFIGGIPPETSEETIQTIFGALGTITKLEWKTREDGLSKGFCFMTFDSQEGAAAALEAKDSHKVGEKWIDVKSCGPGGDVNGKVDYKVIFAGGLPRDVTDESLTAYFSAFGTLSKVDLKKDPETGHSRGFAFITFETDEAGKACVDQGTHTMGDKQVDVKAANSDKGGKGKGKGKGKGWQNSWMDNMWNSMASWGAPSGGKGKGGGKGQRWAPY